MNTDPNVPTTPRPDVPLLDIRDLAIDFAQPRPAVNRIDVCVDAGEVVALVGESGSGKSMTARAILGLLPHGARASGSIRVNGKEVLGVPDSVLREVRGTTVAMVFQEPQTALNPVRTVGWQLGEAIRANGRLDRRATRARAIDLLREVEVPEPERRVDSYPHQLSGGQKQRVVLALALAGSPALLLADEPTTALDVTVQAEIMALLRRLRDRNGTSILLITHNMGVVAEIADRVVVLKTGDVVDAGPTVDLFARPRHAYTRQLLSAVPTLPNGGPHDDTGVKPWDVLIEDAAVRFDDVSVEYAGRGRRAAFTAVSGVSIAAAAGEVLGFVGESGSGKTTLGRVAAGLVRPSAGRVTVLGEDLGEVSAGGLRDLRRRLAFVHQDPAASLDPRLTIGTSIREPLDVHAVGDRDSRDERVAMLLDAVRLPATYAERLPRELSGGQRQRVAMARALALEPSLVIADEPTSALDVSVQAEVLELFKQLQRELAFACLFISHDLAVVHQVSDRVAVLRAGDLVEAGPATRVFTQPRHEYTRRLLAAVPVPDPSARDTRTAPAVAV